MRAQYVQVGATERGLTRAALFAVLGVLWHAMRLPALALLSLLEPIIRLVLAGLALLGALTALFFGLVGPADFPFATMLAVSIGFAAALLLYHLLIWALSM